MGRAGLSEKPMGTDFSQYWENTLSLSAHSFDALFLSVLFLIVLAVVSNRLQSSVIFTVSNLLDVFVLLSKMHL